MGKRGALASLDLPSPADFCNDFIDTRSHLSRTTDPHARQRTEFRRGIARLSHRVLIQVTLKRGKHAQVRPERSTTPCPTVLRTVRHPTERLRRQWVQSDGNEPDGSRPLERRTTPRQPSRRRLANEVAVPLLERSSSTAWSPVIEPCTEGMETPSRLKPIKTTVSAVPR